MPEQNDPTAAPASKPIDDLFASPGLGKAVESDEFKRFLDHVPIALAVSKLIADQQRIVYVNRAFEHLVGTTMAEAEDKTWDILDQFVNEDDAQVSLAHAILAGGDFLGTFGAAREGAKPVLVQAYAGTIENDDGTENYRLAALVDVSEHERAQREEFEREIRGKEMLLLELQHRVKNNLQLIIAMIRFEARQSRSGEAVNLDRLAGRIESLQFLYQAISTDAFMQRRRSWRLSQPDRVGGGPRPRSGRD